MLVVAGSCWSACTYDFDAAFSETPTGAAGGTGGEAGAPTGGGSGLTGNQGGQGAGGGQGGIPTGGTGGSGAESCTNGTDDDDDTLVDCADPDCGAYACAPLPPANWTGPIAVGLVAGSDPLPSCPSGWPATSTAYDNLVSAPAECTDCACADGMNSCSLPSLRSYSISDCSTLEATFAPVGVDICTPFSVVDMDALRSSSVQATIEQDCTPSGGEPEATAPTWSLQARLCLGSPLGGGCETGSACVPGATVSFALCIMRAGDELCPPGYPEKTELHSGYDDNRGCTACTCNGWPSCNAHTDVWFTATDCTGVADETLPPSTTCVSTTMNAVSGSFRFVAETTWSCTPTGGIGQGSVTPTDPITVCCSS